MKKSLIVLCSLAAAASLVAVASCTSAAPAKTESAKADAPKAEAAAAFALNVGANPIVYEGFENVGADNRLMVGTNTKKAYVNLTNEGWGGTRNVTIEPSTEYVTEGKYSAKIKIDTRVSSRLNVNGACLGMGWENSGMFDPAYGKYLPKVAYVVMDYTWIPAENCDIANPKIVNLGLHISAKDAAMSAKSGGQIDNMGITDPSGKGTLVVKMANTLTSGCSLAPQWAVKLYHSCDPQDSKGLAADVGKYLRGTLYLDNIRFADASGNVFQK
jgi:hypothetical protein